jgi:hypothetical protein
MEERLSRLEEAMIRLSSPRRDHLPLQPETKVMPSEFVDPLDEVKPIPRATPIPPAPPASLAEFALPPPVPDASLRPLQLSQIAAQTVGRVLPPSALLRDLWWDFRTGWRMLRDPSYPMSLAGKVVPLFALFYVCIWPWFSSWSGILGTLLSGLVNIAVLYLAFKVIQRELRRYYDFSQRYRR